MKNKTIIFLVIALTVSIGISYYYKTRTDRKQDEINKLIIEVKGLKNQEPKEIVVTNKEIQYVYRDGEKIIETRIPDGYVKFDISAYEEAKKEMDRLTADVSFFRDAMKHYIDKNSETADSVKYYEKKISALNDGIQLLRSRLYDVNNDQSFVKIQTRGWLFKPEVGIGYSDKMVPYGGLRLGFWNRWSGGIGVTSRQAGLSVSRYIDDIVPFSENSRITVLYGAPFKSEYGKVFIGLAVDF